jgi:hypothetical protein
VAAFSRLAGDIFASTPKPRPALERFLRADPLVVLANEKPALALPPDSLKILANMSPETAEAWLELVEVLVEYADFFPMVEFRSIHHGLWVVNYTHNRGKRDLCGLITQNGEAQVRVILYEKTHFQVRAALDNFNEPIREAFRRAHYYEDFKHQWLFISLNSREEVGPLQRLLKVAVQDR